MSEETLARLVTQTVSESVVANLSGIESAAEVTGVSVEVINELCLAGCLRPQVVATRQTEYYFDDESIYRLRRVRELQETQGVNLAGIRIILGLVEELRRLEGELQFLREQR